MIPALKTAFRAVKPEPAGRRVALVVRNVFTHDVRVLKEALSLERAGFSVTVLAVHGASLPESEAIDGIRVRRIRILTAGWPRNVFFRALGYLEFVIRAVALCRDAEIIHCNDLDALAVGFISAAFRGRKVGVVYDAHEYETEVKGFSGFRKSISRMLERFLLKRVDALITVSPGIADEYVRLYGVQRPALVLNAPPYRETGRKNLFRERLGIGPGSAIFLFHGGLTPQRGIETLLEAFKLVRDGSSALVFLGYGPLEPLVRKYSAECGNIFFLPAVPPAELADYVSSADWGIFFYENSCLNHYYCLPNRLFEYIMAGIPMIVSDLFELRKFVEGLKIGIVVGENSVAALRIAIIAAGRMTEEERVAMKGRIELLKRTYCWEEQEKVLLGVYAEVVKKRSAAGGRAFSRV